MSVKNKIIALFEISKREYEWIRDYSIWRRMLPMTNVKELTDEKILILAPHSDDEWVGCSQLLINKKNDVTVMNMSMNGGDSTSVHLERFKEMKKVSEKYKYTLETVEKDKYYSLKKYMKTSDVSIIMVPCYFDWHEEHIEVMHILDKIATEIGYDGHVAMYQVSVPIPYQMITNGSLMKKKVARNKWKLLKDYYPSQRYLKTRRFFLNEKINGAVASAYAIEGYCLMPYKKWSYNLKKYALDDEEKNCLKSNLQHIGVIRDELQRILVESKRDEDRI